MRLRPITILCALAACAPAPPRAGIGVEPCTGEAPLRMHFQDDSKGDVDTWRWDFGDGSTSSERDPVHVYHEAGSYDVSLTVSGPGGEATATLPGHVTVEGSAPGNNVLVIVADDVSVAEIEAYGVNPDLRPGLTPTISGLAERGVLFETAWTNPLCSPSRAQILTGRHAFRTGIGAQIETGDIGLAPEEVTLNEALRLYADGAYTSAAFGKWHLENRWTEYVCSPTDLHDFDVYEGNQFQVERYDVWLDLACPPPDGAVEGVWKTDNIRDESSLVEGYMPAYLVDRAAEWIEAQTGPWFCYLAPQTPYHTLHVPPADLQDVVEGVACEPCAVGDRACYDAALMAFDTKIGHLLERLGPDWEETTTVVFLADNGVPLDVVRHWPPLHGKGKLFEGGVRVPLIIAGRAVAPERRGTRATELICSTDLYRTILHLTGAEDVPDAIAQDSIDFLPLLRTGTPTRTRDFLFAEHLRPNSRPAKYVKHVAAVRDERYKLHYDALRGEPTAFYDLATDPLEEHDLLQTDEHTPEREPYRRLLRAVRETLDS